ncbi:AbrB family transcriptional regulator [Ensifer sp. YR511]|uniref:AbrB family transcriptional regulator n=1 Tax=Ensifer sp. YR511 TaxID=1855294 RepID=UPI00088D9945|nr:AbrB family transcriptional regulator [Ensifer sp. YR511]SDN95145.1 hypothetical protein SAMN05216328_1447 [Ensifer sp. YR511]
MTYVLPILAAAVGGYLLEVLSIPNGLLIGATLAGLLFCSFYRRAQVVPFSLQFMQIVLGISLGITVGPSDPLVASDWLTAAGLTVLCLTLQVGTSYIWLRKVSRWPAADAALASYPGAMAAVLDLLGKSAAGPKVLIVHMMRIIFLTFAASLLVWNHIPAPTQPLALSLPVLFVAAAIVASSLVLGRIMANSGVPAPYMLVALVFGAFGSSMGLLEGFHVPQLMLDGAIILLAALITINVKNIDKREFFPALRAGGVALLLTLTWTVTIAVLAAWLLDYEVVTVLLSCVPGAVESVAFVAVVSGLDVAFILKVHLMRLLFAHLSPALLLVVRKEGLLA